MLLSHGEKLYLGCSMARLIPVPCPSAFEVAMAVECCRGCLFDYAEGRNVGRNGVISLDVCGYTGRMQVSGPSRNTQATPHAFLGRTVESIGPTTSRCSRTSLLKGTVKKSYILEIRSAERLFRSVHWTEKSYRNASSGGPTENPSMRWVPPLPHLRSTSPMRIRCEMRFQGSTHTERVDGRRSCASKPDRNLLARSRFLFVIHGMSS